MSQEPPRLVRPLEADREADADPGAGRLEDLRPDLLWELHFYLSYCTVKGAPIVLSGVRPVSQRRLLSASEWWIREPLRVRPRML